MATNEGKFQPFEPHGVETSRLQGMTQPSYPSPGAAPPHPMGGSLHHCRCLPCLTQSTWEMGAGPGCLPSPQPSERSGGLWRVGVAPGTFS